MNGEKLGQEPAFPIEEMQKGDGICSLIPYLGMSKRFYAACAAMQGLLSNSQITLHFERINSKVEQEREAIITASFELADELLKQEYL